MKQNDDAAQPPLPLNWDRCHAYNRAKRRFCRQAISPSLPKIDGEVMRRGDVKPVYCGNHVHLYDCDDRTITPSSLTSSLASSSSSQQQDSSSSQTTTQEKIETGDQNTGCDGGDGRDGKRRRKKGRRIPCPIDPSHTIYESQLKKHVRKCPKATIDREERSKVYYRRDINKGGFGEGGVRLLEDDTLVEERRQRQRLNEGAKEPQPRRGKSARSLGWDTQKCQAFALGILDAYTRLFLLKQDQLELTQNVEDKDEYLRSLTADDLYKGVPSEDLFDSEQERGMEKDLLKNRIKMGGSKHVRQIGSIVGHIRKWGLLDDTSASSTSTTNSNNARIVLEMGAGRGTTGFVVASAFGMAATTSAKNSARAPLSKSLRGQKHSDVRLVMVEKAGSRAQVDTAIRRQLQPKNDDGSHDNDKNTDADSKVSSPMSDNGYLNVEKVSVTRIRCDLAHVHLPSALDQIDHEKIIDMRSNEVMEDVQMSRQESEVDATEEDIVVIAKHLCGAGTDLALKSINPISSRVKACVLATCCHGLCTWDDYVGRDYLRDVMATTTPHNAVSSFDHKEFDLMRRWASGTVITHSKDSAVVGDDDVSGGQHSNDAVFPITSQDGATKDVDVCNIGNIISSMGLQCGVNGLGRACQRLIDYGRCQYMEKHLFRAKKVPVVVNMCHYVNADITPQNALLKAINN